MYEKYVNIVFGFLLLIALYVINTYNYLLFHSIVELVISAIAFSVFIFTWNARKYTDNHFYLFLGISFIFTGFINLFHIISYKGMGVFPEHYGANISTQLWIVMRYVTGISFFIAPFFVKRKFNEKLVVTIFFVIISALFASIFYWNIFPNCYIDGIGLTRFKKISEYIIILFFSGSLYLLWKIRKEFDLNIFKLLILSITLSIIAELFFTFYANAYDTANLLGHFFILISFYLIYKSILIIGINKPHDIIFRQLKQGEERLKEEKSVIAAVIENTEAHLAYLDSDFNFIFVNSTYAKMNKHSVDWFVGKNHFRILPNEENEFIFKKVRDTGEPISFKAKPFKFPGQPELGVTYWDWTLTPIKDSAGKVQHLVLSLVDVTEAKRVEEMLRESNNFSQSLLQTIPFGMDIVDEEGNILFVNKKLEDLFREKIIGKKCWSVYRDDKKQCIICPLRKGINISETATIEAERVFGGKTLQVTHTGMIYKGKKAILEIFEDITDRKKVEEKIKHLASFPEFNPDPVLELDLSGKVIFYNKATSKVLNDLKIKDDASVFIPKDIFKIIEIFKEGKTDLTLWEIKIGNKYFKENIYYTAQFNSVRIYVDDITQLRCAEEELKKENLKLLESDRKKTEFISVVSHDLRTPLTSIMGFADTLKNKKLKLDEEQKETFVGYIQEESRRLGRLISDFLDISNIEDGSLKIIKQKTDINQLINNMINMFKINKKDIQIIVEFESNLPEINVDEDRIKQVIQNIISNAIKYSPPESVINIDAKKVNSDIQVTIRDQGVGIPDKEKEKVFEKHHRIDTHISRKERGTGLGLAISKAIIEIHNGRIWIEDNLPVGSKFIFKIPIL